MFLIIALPKISCVDNIIQKSEKSFLDPRTSHGNRVICEIWTERYKSSRTCHAYVASSLYPIAGSENVSRCFGSPWGQECRTRTFSDQPSTTINHHQPHIHTSTIAHKNKNKQPYPWSLHQHGESYFFFILYYILYFNPPLRFTTLESTEYLSDRNFFNCTF